MLARQVMLNCGAFDNFGAGCNGAPHHHSLHASYAEETTRVGCHMSKMSIMPQSCVRQLGLRVTFVESFPVNSACSEAHRRRHHRCVPLHDKIR